MTKLVERRRINHRGPVSIDVSSAWYFITICAEGHQEWVCAGRDGVPSPSENTAAGGGTPALPMDFNSIANVILSAARWYHEHGKWSLALFLVMPDHVHFIVHVPNVGRDGVPSPSENTTAGGGTPALPHVIRHWKHYLAEHHGLRFQRDFWDTRLRDDAHFAESFRYICNNPVRKGLCAKAIDWPHVIAFDRATGEERAHRGAVAEKGGVR